MRVGRRKITLFIVPSTAYTHKRGKWYSTTALTFRKTKENKQHRRHDDRQSNIFVVGEQKHRRRSSIHTVVVVIDIRLTIWQTYATSDRHHQLKIPSTTKNNRKTGTGTETVEETTIIIVAVTITAARSFSPFLALVLVVFYGFAVLRLPQDG